MAKSERWAEGWEPSGITSVLLLCVWCVLCVVGEMFVPKPLLCGWKVCALTWLSYWLQTFFQPKTKKVEMFT